MAYKDTEDNYTPLINETISGVKKNKENLIPVKKEHSKQFKELLKRDKSLSESLYEK